jgi:hypothetical protein
MRTGRGNSTWRARFEHLSDISGLRKLSGSPVRCRAPEESVRSISVRHIVAVECTLRSVARQQQKVPLPLAAIRRVFAVDGWDPSGSRHRLMFILGNF